ncbi:MAG: DUF4251 domain-containing protein [Bacteroidales bacterium]|nr:DUF4251 domain-containing protein [Bacteroidales bacterium]
MNRLLCLLFVGVISISAIAQDTSKMSKREQRKLLREERRLEAAEAREQQAKLVALMMKTNAFVLEANMLFDKYGQSTPVSPSINFILVDSLYGVIQVGSPMYLGQNGVGGVTVEGSVSNYEMSKNEKKGTYQVNYLLRSPVGSYDVSMNVSPSGHADARVNGNFSGQLRYSGRLVPPAETRVYQGTSF